jgi:DNA-binding response OmpR family regulator
MSALAAMRSSTAGKVVIGVDDGKDFIGKPFDTARLLARIRHWTSREVGTTSDRKP